MNLKGVCPLLGVYDMPTSVRFYRDKLGFEIVSHSPHLGGDDPDRFHWCWLRHGDADIMLNTNYEFDEDRPVRPAEYRAPQQEHVCIYFGCPDVDGAYEELRSRGVDVRAPKVERYGMKDIALRDPDGFSLVFHWQANQNPDREGGA